jgi:hypothetical protein
VGWHGPSAPTPPGTALSDFARRNPSEIPSQTQSVSAFLPGKVSMGTQFLQRITLQGMPPLPVSLQLIKNRKATGRLQACRLNASPRSVSCAGNYCPRYFTAASHHRQWSVSLFFSLTLTVSSRIRASRTSGLLDCGVRLTYSHEMRSVRRNASIPSEPTIAMVREYSA